MSTEQIHIHLDNVTSFVLSVRFLSHGTLNGIKTMETERRREKRVTAVAMQLLPTGKRKLNTTREQPSVKNLNLRWAKHQR